MRAGALLVLALAGCTSPHTYFPSRSWQEADPARAGWSIRKLAEAREFAATIDTSAYMVIENGQVIDSYGDVTQPLNCHSMRKSILSLLYGAAIAEGLINLDKTLADLGINDNEPSLTPVERSATVRDLLEARSGVYHPALYETPAMAARRPQRGSHPPDTFWYYNNWDFNALGTIYENLTGRSVFEAFEDELARPLHMQDFDRRKHTEYVTGDDSVHPAYPFTLSARDLARIGVLALNRGRWHGTQLIPANWIDESVQSYSDAGTSGGYGYLWWIAVNGKHLPFVTLPDGSYSARGYRGHYVLVVPEWKLVVVHRVNTFLPGTSVSQKDFGKLLSLIVAARPGS